MEIIWTAVERQILDAGRQRAHVPMHPVLTAYSQGTGQQTAGHLTVPGTTQTCL